ncbi:25-hydroxycholesterol 7-alpha-hydroxylase [Austrofundulus limnaeus]|uniref:25-hydroxycholesterol 7-alpha-hydroxylase-like n=1 Tax=Austrofundulus limnaeus TaxID=52670 RepID=A0A2I4CZ07_AUSLI|nr:PREDICTED: 25-hydroxycholesterol 7-alpha-hydroxylase-like [Austrofundulus limnaeus]XP_013885210.1 PREDICTED: 25-hydroxycholesterol 7-alpha-hydroxylase-like [Austrofundulus limnaeus]
MVLLLLLLGLLGLLLFLLHGRKRRQGEPPLIKGWVPFLGNTLQFGKNAHKFLEDQKRKNGDVFTVLIAGKYMTFIMDPLLYPSIIKHGRQLDFHELTERLAPLVFGYPSMKTFPGLSEQISRAYRFLQGDSLTSLTESMMGNLMLVFCQDHLDPGQGWRSGNLYEFCSSVMFEATFLTIYGRPQTGSRHQHMDQLLKDFLQFDAMFPYLSAEVPIWLLGRTKTVRQKLISHFLPQRLSCWSDKCQFIQARLELFNLYDKLRDVDKAAHHFTILWASVGNTLPATFWATFDLVAHPEALKVVRQEILDVLRASGVEFSPDRELTLSREQLDKLVFLESSIKESLRLSSASMNLRVAQEDFSLRLDAERSVAVRKGDIITLYPQSMHLDPEIYEDPQTFHFDRFVEDGREKTDFRKHGQKLKYYLMPFGSGSSKCPGRYFAVNEIKQFVCLLLLYLDLQLEDGQNRPSSDHSRAGLGIQQPSSPVLFRYRPRAE